MQKKRSIFECLGWRGWLAVALLTLLGGPAALAQPLTGAYTINSAQATAGTNFATFTAAAAALNMRGVSGPVTFDVSGGPYTEQFSLSALTGASATNRVVFNGNGRTIRFGSSVSTQRAVITLNGADFVTLDSLDVDATNGGMPGTYGWGIQLVNSADNNIIRRCNVTSSTTSASTFFAGIVSSGSATSPTTAGANANQNLTIEGCTVTGGYYGITAIGNTTASPSPGMVLRNNRVLDFYVYGMYHTYLDAPQITGNEMARPTRATVSTFYGLYVGAGVRGARVEKNRIHQGFSAAASSTSVAYCLYVITGTAATATAPNDFINNLIYDVDGNGTVYGIYNFGSSNCRYYHNTISLDDQTNTSTNATYGFYHTTGMNVEFRNNIVRITRSGTGVKYALFFSSATGGNIISNYNNLSGSGPGFFTGRYISTDYATLTDWRTANGGAYDANSVDAAPGFVNVAAGNLRPTAAGLNNQAQPLARVSDDITGAPRGATPDMGAYEFTPAVNDVVLNSIGSPVAPVTPGSRPVTVTITNNGSAPLTTLTLSYVFNGGTPVTQVVTLTPALASGASRTITLTAPVVIVAGPNSLTVTASLPNGQPDPTPNSNMLTTNLFTTLSGVYTINSTLPTGGRNFASFSDAGDALNQAGVSAAVTFNVSAGPYTEQMLLNNIIGASATSPVVFNGNGRTIQFGSNNASQRAVITLDGADYVTLDSLNVDASFGSGTYGWGIQLVNSADNNIIRRCNVTSSTTSTSTFFAGIVSSGSATGATSSGANANQNLTIEDCTVTGGYYGITAIGNTTAAPSPGIIVRNTRIRDFYYYGLYSSYSEGAQFIGNDIARPTRTTVSLFYGIFLTTGTRGARVEKNRVHQAFAAAGSTSTAYGIYLTTSTAATAAQPNEVINNLVYDLDGNGTVYGLYNGSSSNTRYYHNTVNIDDQTNTSGNATYGFYHTTGMNVEFRNNIVRVTRSGTGVKYALFFSSATGNNIQSNYNNLVVGTGAGYNTGYYLTAYATLADWQAANSGAYDQNSVAIAPVYVNLAAGNLQPTAPALDNLGTPLPRVSDDIVGTPRSATAPDMGAYEYSPTPDDVVLLSIDAPTSPSVPTATPVTVTIRNGGTAVLMSVTLTYILNGNAPVVQTFTGLSLAPNATQQLTFTSGVVAPSGTNTLTVTATLPNNNADGNPGNNTLTITYDQPIAGNDEPCAAVALTNGAVNTSSTLGASTSIQPGIPTALPTCAGAQQPKDVWFTTTVAAGSNGLTLDLTGTTAGTVRVFSSASCSAGPFTQEFCQASAGNNQAVGTVTVPGLTAGTTYYIAVSGYGSASPTGPFGITATSVTITGTRAAGAAALAVFPNPSATGQLTLRLAQPAAGSAALLNGLGQVVRQQSLTATAAEQTLPTTGLAAGLYTLRVQLGSEVITRKVVLQ